MKTLKEYINRNYINFDDYLLNYTYEDFLEDPKDIIITLPSKIEWSDYEKELEAVKDESQVMNFKVPFLPKYKPEKVYICHRGNIIGWMKCCGMDDGKSFDCTTTSKHWEGKFIQRTGEFHKIEPIPMKGFQGFRYFK